MIGRRCAQAQSTAARGAAVASGHAGSSLVAPGLEYSACKIFPGEVPRHYIPAVDDSSKKNSTAYRRGATTQMQVGYGPNIGRYDYGRLQDRPKLYQILFMERFWVTRQSKNMLYMCLWFIPMAGIWYQRQEAKRIGRTEPQGELRANIFTQIFRFFYW